MCFINNVFEGVEIVSTISNSPETFLGVLSFLYISAMPTTSKFSISEKYFISNNNSLRLANFEDKGRRGDYSDKFKIPNKNPKQPAYARRMMHCNKVQPVLTE